MPDLGTIIVAAATGVCSGLLLSIPIGPVNLTIMNEGARGGFARAAVIGLGASLMEVIYCTIAFAGFASMLTGDLVRGLMEVVSFAFLVGLGLKFLMTERVPAATRFETRIERGLDPHSAFMMGFVRVMANPGVLLFWIVLAAHFISWRWVAETWPAKGACIVGVMVGTSMWFVTISYTVSLGQGKFSERTLVRMQKGSGLGLLGLGMAHGLRIALELAKHYQSHR
jgi:threonine/homoserine/homoserine lactone efflux protein